MTNKQKSIIAIIVSIAVIVMFIVIFQNKKSVSKTSQAPVVQTIETVKVDPVAKEQPVVQKVLPKEVKGQIVAMSPTFLIIEQATGALTVTFDINNTPIFKGTIKTSALDLKAGVNVTAAIDQDKNIASKIMIE